MKLPRLVMTDKERAQRAALPRAVQPKIASTIVLYTGSKDNPKILMGQRASRHDFMPSVYVFPGGRVDRADNYAAFHGDLSPRTERILESAYAPRKARACVLAAIRETWEETGLMLGRPRKWYKNINHPSWDDFRERAITPDLSDIEVFGRAITPPHRHKRFDTWFFIQKFEGDLDVAMDSHELLNVGWFTYAEISELKTHRATQMMLMVLKAYMERPTPNAHIFYSHMSRGSFKQERFPAK